MIYFEEIKLLIEEAISLSTSYFINPEKRIYILYLLSSLVLAFYVYYSKTNKKESFLKFIFNKKVWWNKSSIIDYLFFFFNSLIKILFIAPYVYFSFVLAFYTTDILEQSFGFYQINHSQIIIIIGYTLSLTIVNDFFSYILHYLMHHNKILWEFHKIHHSATTLNPITQYRIHPIELLINNLRSIFIFGIITGIFNYLSSQEINKLLFLGVNIFSFLFYLFGANLRHSHVKLSYPKLLERIFISPYQHQIHHSINEKHYNKNMGSKLAIWDWMFGTLVYSGKTKSIRYGIKDIEHNYQGFWHNIIKPFIESKNIVLSYFNFSKKDK